MTVVIHGDRFGNENFTTRKAKTSQHAERYCCLKINKYLFTFILRNPGHQSSPDFKDINSAHWQKRKSNLPLTPG
jgi:hypothetical protein